MKIKTLFCFISQPQLYVIVSVKQHSEPCEFVSIWLILRTNLCFFFLFSSLISFLPRIFFFCFQFHFSVSFDSHESHSHCHRHITYTHTHTPLVLLSKYHLCGRTKGTVIRYTQNGHFKRFSRRSRHLLYPV